MKEQTRPAWIRPILLGLHPSAFLLAAQSLQLILYAVFDGLYIQRALISAVSVIVLIFVVWVVIRSPASNWVAWILAVPAFVIALLSAFSTNPALLAWSALLEAALYFYAAGSMIAYMMQDHQVTTDELFAAGATFTLFAWGYAYLYIVIQTWSPGSFTNGVEPVKARTFIELLFLSFTNLTATGLSDIVPVTNWARILVMLEQFTGVGYVAVVVSRLVGLTLQRESRKRA